VRPIILGVPINVWKGGINAIPHNPVGRGERGVGGVMGRRELAEEVKRAGAVWLYHRQGGGVVFNEMQVGSVIHDVFGVIYQPKYEHTEKYSYPVCTGHENIFRGIEVKVDRDDFLREFKKGNDVRKKNVLDYFWFLLTPGILREKDYPRLKNIGVLEYRDGKIVSIKNARRLKPIVKDFYERNIWRKVAISMFNFYERNKIVDSLTDIRATPAEMEGRP